MSATREALEKVVAKGLFARAARQPVTVHTDPTRLRLLSLLAEGELTVSELTRIVGQSIDCDKTPVAELMTKNPDTLPNDASVAYALNRMSEEGYRHVPLLDDDGSPVGVVGMRDIIHWMAELYPARVLNIPPAPKSFPSTPEGA